MAGRSEYSRLRDIARKRNIRLVEQGLTAPVTFPRLRDIRNDPIRVEKELQKLRQYVQQGATVRAVKKSGTGFYNPQFGMPPFGLEGKEKARAKRKPLTPEQRARKNQRARERYAERKALEQIPARDQESIRKAIQKFKRMRDQLRNTNIPGLRYDPEKMFLDAKGTRDFALYLENRMAMFDQQVWYQQYLDALEDYAEMQTKGYNYADIAKDFNDFLIDQSGMDERAADMAGVSGAEMQDIWTAYIDRL